MVEARRLQAGRSMVHARDSEGCVAATGEAGKGLCSVALGSQQGPEQGGPLAHRGGGKGRGENFEFCSKRNGEHFLTKQVKHAYLFVPVQDLFLPSGPCHSHSGKLVFLGSPE